LKHCNWVATHQKTTWQNLDGPISLVEIYLEIQGDTIFDWSRCRPSQMGHRVNRSASHRVNNVHESRDRNPRLSISLKFWERCLCAGARLAPALQFFVERLRIGRRSVGMGLLVGLDVTEPVGLQLVPRRLQLPLLFLEVQYHAHVLLRAAPLLPPSKRRYPRVSPGALAQPPPGPPRRHGGGLPPFTHAEGLERTYCDSASVSSTPSSGAESHLRW
jgi:hypothetical protein